MLGEVGEKGGEGGGGVICLYRYCDVMLCMYVSFKVNQSHCYLNSTCKVFF